MCCLPCTCASNSSKHPRLGLIHGSSLASEPLPQDGHAAPSFVQQGTFLGSLGLRNRQDTLLLEGMQLSGVDMVVSESPVAGQLAAAGKVCLLQLDKCVTQSPELVQPACSRLQLLF